jgi:hypothetical protein
MAPCLGGGMKRVGWVLVGVVVFGIGLAQRQGTPRVLATAEAQDSDDAQKREYQMGRAIGSGLALACYTSIQHLGSLSDVIQAGKATPQTQVKLAVIHKLLGSYEDELTKTGKILKKEDAKQLEVFSKLMTLTKKAAKALEAFGKSPNEETARAFREAQKKAWGDMAKAFDWDAQVSGTLAPSGLNAAPPKK